jgi:hypothetical protein
MPVPIKSIPDNGYSSNKNTIDYSFLLTDDSVKKEKIVVASDKDADLLFKIWSMGKAQGRDTICLDKDDKITQDDLLRLKSKGFLMGDAEKVKFTKRGKMVITTMALGEPSKFENIKQPKKYTEILAGISKRGKKGYRMASGNPELNINSSNSLNLKEAWDKKG